MGSRYCVSICFCDRSLILIIIRPLIPPATEFSVSSRLREKVIPGGDPKEPTIRVIAVAWANDAETAKKMLKEVETCPSIDKAYKTILAQECTLEQVSFSFDPHIACILKFVLGVQSPRECSYPRAVGA